jgi:hypothetical protein
MAMIAITTKSSISVKAEERRREMRGSTTTTFLPSRAKTASGKTRQAGLLAYGSWRRFAGLPVNSHSGLENPSAWPITAAVPQRLRTVFPSPVEDDATCS